MLIIINNYSMRRKKNMHYMLVEEKNLRIKIKMKFYYLDR